MPRKKAAPRKVAEKAAPKQLITDVLVTAFMDTGKAFAFKVLGDRADLIAAFNEASLAQTFVEVQVLNLVGQPARLAINPRNVAVIGETYDAAEAAPKPPPPPPPQQPRAAPQTRRITVEDLIRSGLIVPEERDDGGPYVERVPTPGYSDPGRGRVLS